MTKKDLKEILAMDLARYEKKPTFKDWLINNESWFIFHLIEHLRYIEYHKDKKGLHKIAYLYHYILYKRLSLKLHITLYPGTIAGGFRIYHIGGFTHIGSNCRIGKNCTIVSGVVFGNKYEKDTKELTYVGNNCYFGIDSKIIGSINIGNNVTIGANSVITKNIVDNAIVAGVPAKIIKIKE